MSEVKKEIYKKLSYREHVRLRSSMYLGTTSLILQDCLIVYDEGDILILKEDLTYPPALYKICDEIIVNAIDHITRTKTYKGSNKCNNIKCNFNKLTGEFSVFNDGTGIEVLKYENEDYYIPELLFSKEMSGSNFDENTDSIIGGLNGSGSKLTNIMSEYFIIETIDSINKKSYYQKFEDGNLVINKPIIKPCKSKPMTKITFKPEYELFYKETGYTMELGDLLDKIIKTRMYYASIFCKNSNIFYNDTKITINKLEQFAKLLIPDKTKLISTTLTSKTDEYVWDIVLGIDNEYNDISVINGIIAKGGTHFKYIQKLIKDNLKAKLEKLMKGKNKINTTVLTDNLVIMMTGNIENCDWQSQSKNQLNVNINQFKNYKFEDNIYTKIWSKLKDQLSELYLNSELKDLDKTNGKKKKRIESEKLDDAEYAGTSQGHKCKLFLTEGDSAKTYAITGLGSPGLGKEYYGVFPLKGKCISECTYVPLWNGNIKFAKDIQIGDIIIGDDGNKREVLTLFKGNGKMYEINQTLGNSYKVNGDHILTLCMPEHKSIYWLKDHKTWRTLYWDKTVNNIKIKEMNTFIKVECNECKLLMKNQSLKRHYKRKHKDIQFEKSKSIINMDDPKIIQAYKNLQEFLLNIDDNNIIDINIQDYLKSTKLVQLKLKGIRGQCINWEEKEVLLDPYVLGLWLGDGAKSGYSYACDGENDYQIIDYLNEWGLKNNAKLKQSGNYSYNFSSITNFRKMGEAPLKKLLSNYGLINNKHIPREYLINSKNIRLKILAGIIDSDGYICIDGTIEISQTTKHKQLVDDIVYMSRSLGFYTHIKQKITNYKYKKTGKYAEAYIIKISGDVENIPTLLPRKKPKSTRKYNNRLSTGSIKIKSIIDCNYVGIGIDGNNRFLINDFTVTHNCLNVRGESAAKINSNAEITELKKIIGLKHNHKYESLNELRYGGIICLTDQDLDGYHIKSLIINMIHAFWPELIELGFICSFATPIIKMTKNKNTMIFYTLSEYNEWCKNNSTSGWNVEYFKGLGTSEDVDILKNFENFDNKLITYTSDINIDKSINLGFNKKLADDRKEWLLNYDKDNIIKQVEKQVDVTDVINKELIHFSHYDVHRSIPNIMDGFKPSQRKIIYAALNFIKDNTIKQKVSNFAGRCIEKTDYHHGNVSMEGTIINMGQNYIGSNNCNLLLPKGQFGSRLENGKDAASSRYIFTNYSEITSKLIKKEDNKLLKYVDSDGTIVEPEYYMPVLPIILINGSIGIGTGFSTTIHPHKVEDISNYILNKLNNKRIKKFKPWYRNFQGTITEVSKNKYDITGNYDFFDDKKMIIISEIPTGKNSLSTKKYHLFLESLIINKSVTNKLILQNQCLDDVKDKGTKKRISFELYFKSDEYRKVKLLTETELLNKFKLVNTISESNMHLFNKDNIITKYKTIYEIIDYFIEVRLEYYVMRKELMIKSLELDLLVLLNKVRFIKGIIDKTIKIMNIKKGKVYLQLEQMRFYKYKDNYDYLINMSIGTLTYERVIKLEDEYKNKEAELGILRNTEVKELWINDINDVLIENKRYNNTEL